MTGAPQETGEHRGWRVVRESALWVAAAIGAISLIASAVALLFGLTPLIFRTGSMSPEIPAGSLGLGVRTPAGELQRGDVVSVQWSSGDRVTHRLVEAEASASGTRLTTKGDANDVVDVERPIVVSVDRVVWSVPRLGFVVQELTKPQYVFAVGVVIGAIIVLSFRSIGATRTRSPAAIVAASLLVAGVLSAPPAPHGTLAAFIDPAVARANVATGTVGVPTITGCTLISTGLLTFAVRVVWSAPTAGVAPASYQLTYSGIRNGAQSTSAFSADIPVGVLSIGTMSIAVRGVSHLWQSAPATRTATLTTSLLGFGCV